MNLPPPSGTKPGLQVGFVYDLRADYLAQGLSPEDAAEFDAEVTLDGIAQAIRALGHSLERIGNARALCGRLARGERWELVFNFTEGLAGRSREAQAPALLELFGIPYTFSDPLTCAATLDKAVAKRLVRDAGLATAPFHVVRAPADLAAVALAYPLFAKPLAEGTGKGIDERSRIGSPAELDAVCRRLLERYAQPVLVEEFLPGREFTVGVLGTGPRARVLGTLEITLRQPASGSIYSFESKEECDRLVTYTTPPADDLRRALEALALNAHRALECRDASRVDLRLDRRGQPMFMETNPLPGLNPGHSDLPMIAYRAGWTFQDLIGAILDSACERLGRTPS